MLTTGMHTTEKHRETLLFPRKYVGLMTMYYRPVPRMYFNIKCYYFGPLFAVSRIQLNNYTKVVLKSFSGTSGEL